MAKDLATVNALYAQVCQEVVWVEEMTARAREIHDDLEERIDAADDNRSSITVGEIMDALSQLRRIGAVIDPWMDTIQRDLDAIQRYYLAVAEGRCDGGLAGHPEVATALAYRLPRSRL